MPDSLQSETERLSHASTTSAVPYAVRAVVDAVNAAPYRSLEQCWRLAALDGMLATADGCPPSASALQGLGVQLDAPNISEARLLARFFPQAQLDALDVDAACVPLLPREVLLECARASKRQEDDATDEGQHPRTARIRAAIATAQARLARQREEAATVPATPGALDECTSATAYAFAWLVFGARLHPDRRTISVPRDRARAQPHVLASLRALLGLPMGVGAGEASLTIRHDGLWARLTDAGAVSVGRAPASCALFDKVPRAFHVDCLRALVDVRGRLEERQPGTPRLRVEGAPAVLRAASQAIGTVLGAADVGSLHVGRRSACLTIGGRRQLTALAWALFGSAPVTSATERRGWWGEHLPSADLPATLTLTPVVRRRARRIGDGDSAARSGLALQPIGSPALERMRRLLEATGMQHAALRPCLRDWGALVLLALMRLCPQCDWRVATAGPLRRRDVTQFLVRHYEFRVTQGQFSAVIQALEEVGLVHRVASCRADTQYLVMPRVLELVQSAGALSIAQLWSASRQLARAAAAARLARPGGRSVGTSRLVLTAPCLVGTREPLVLPRTAQNVLLCVTLGALLGRYPDLQLLWLDTDGASATMKTPAVRRVLQEQGIAPEATALRPDAIATSARAATLWIIEVCVHTNPMFRSRAAEFGRMLGGTTRRVRCLTAFPTDARFRTFAADLVPASEVLISGGPGKVPLLASLEGLHPLTRRVG